jgi:hypothetical protein
MPMKISVGLSKKVGLPGYSSLGASCQVEFEAEATLLQTDREAFYRQVRNAYAACALAVHEELARQQASSGGNGPADHAPNGSSNGHAATPPNGNGHSAGSHKSERNEDSNPPASARQVTYLRQLAGRVEGVGVRRLETLAQRMFAKPLAGLSSQDASRLIDTLRSLKSGEIELDMVLGGQPA